MKTTSTHNHTLPSLRLLSKNPCLLSGLQPFQIVESYQISVAELDCVVFMDSHASGSKKLACAHPFVVVAVVIVLVLLVGL